MKPRTKRCIGEGILASVLTTTLFIITAKTGYNKFTSHSNPSTWTQLFYKLPFFLGVGVVAFLAVFLWRMKFYREQKYCIDCDSVISESVCDDSICPDCGSPTEPLKGVFKRHPELKDKR